MNDKIKQDAYAAFVVDDKKHGMSRETPLVTISCPCMDVTTGKFSHNEEVPLADILDFKDDGELWLFGEEL